MSDSDAARADLVPVPRRATRRATSRKLLLDERLIACANILPAMRSLYVWHGERGEASEVGVLFKTDAAHARPR